MFKGLRKDINAIRERDPAARSALEVLLLYSGLHALMIYRVAHWCYLHRLFFAARFLSQLGKWLTGVEIHPGATIGRNLFIDHGMGIVIGETAEIGDNCTIYHGVTLGGTGHHVGKRHPTIGDNVLIGAGAKVLGPVQVGKNAMIGANATVIRDVAPDTTVVGAAGRAVKRSKQRIPSSDLDQIHLPDPVMQEFFRLHEAIQRLEERCIHLEAQLAEKS